MGDARAYIDDSKPIIFNEGEAVSEEKKYVIVRGDRSGCFAGFLENRNGREVTLTKSRRLWYWDGAASLSQLAQTGTSKPKNCKFPAEIEGPHEILDAIEVIPVTEAAQASIAKVAVWEE